MVDMAVAGAAGEAQQIAARMERLPICSWHTKMRLIMATAWFVDAFDALAIAYVLPVLIGLWKLAPAQIGALISIGYAGQLLGALAAGWMAERWGRVPVLILTILGFALMAFACAFSWSYQSMLWFRLVQGLGLGGMNPVVNAYVNEFAKAKRRGRFSIGLQIFFAVGLFAVAFAGIWVVPRLGWQWMFIIGAVPAALLVLPMWMVLKESPRWLASKGRFAEADRALRQIEDVAIAEDKILPPLPKDLPPATASESRVGDLFRGIYRKRTFTIWCLWSCTYLVQYGLTAWAPSLFTSVYHLPVQQSLSYAFMLSGASFLGSLTCVLLIDHVGRKRLFAVGLIVAALPLLAFSIHVERSLAEVVAMICISLPFISQSSLGLGTYTAENYPNNMRALGLGIAGAWQRGASMVGPLLVGLILPVWGVDAVFVVFGLFALAGGCVCLLFAIETRGQVLEKLAPALSVRPKL